MRTALAHLEWLIELGAVDAIGDVPVDRTALAETVRAVAPTHLASPPVRAASPEPAAGAVQAAQAAEAAGDLAALAAAMEAFDCDLKAGARRFVFAEGTPGAPLMIVGEAPGRDEDREGRPFAGEAGALLDRMLQAIGRDRADPDPARAVYLTGVVPWRPTGALAPAALERWRPFLLRHIALARPRALLILGNAPALALLGRGGMTRLRGAWAEAAGVPALPTFHPDHLLRTPAAKREAWADLQAMRARLDAS